MFTPAASGLYSHLQEGKDLHFKKITVVKGHITITRQVINMKPRV